MNLPKKYEIKDSTPEKFHKHEGKPKISYSQYTSWKDPLYKNDYIRQYFFGIQKDAGIFAEFGSACGQYFEDNTIDRNWLSDSDVEILSKVERPEGAIYEGEIVIDRGDFCIQGFIDQEYLDSGKKVIKDMKTGNVDNKVKFYGSDEYQQTTIYSYAREEEGEEIGYSGVILLGRKGNGRPNYPLKLSGVIHDIPTPYSKERGEKALQDIEKVAYEISDVFTVYQKVNV